MEPKRELSTEAPARFALVVIGGSAEELGRALRLTDGRHLVGRTEGADLRFEVPTMSRRHAVFVVEGDCVIVEDLPSSTSGIYVNDERVPSEKLSPGARIQIGGVLLELVKLEEPCCGCIRTEYEESTGLK